MRFKALKVALGILIFLILAAVFLAALRPTYQRASQMLRLAEQKAFSLLTQKTSLVFSYDAISPSFFSRLSIKGLEARDGATGDEVFTVKKASLQVDFSKLVAGDLGGALKKAQVADVSVMLSRDEIDLIRTTYQASKAAVPKKAMSIERVEEILGKVVHLLPKDTQAQNVHFVFAEDGRDLVTASVKTVSVKKNRKSSSAQFKVKGSVLACPPALKGLSAGTVFELDGTLLAEAGGSFCKIETGDLAAADCSLKRMELLATYDEREATVRTVKSRFQSDLPVELFAQVDLDLMQAQVALEAESADPFELVRVPGYKQSLEYFRGTLVTASVQATGELATLTYSWQGDIAVDAKLPQKICRDRDERIELSATGNNTDIFVERLEFKGEFLAGTFEGSFYIPKLQPAGYLNLEHWTFFMNGNEISGEVFFDPRRDVGFDIFIPQVYFGDYVCYTGFQAFAILGRSIELTVEVNDFSHPDYDVPGRVVAEGSLQLGKNMSLQASAEVENFFVDTGVKTGAFFAERDGVDILKGAEKFCEPYICNAQAYFETDFKEFSYNAPVVLAANTTRDREFCVVSFDGSGVMRGENLGTEARLWKADLVAGRNMLYLSGGLDVRPRKKNLDFYTELSFNSIPYNIEGFYIFDDWLSATGSYGVDLAVNFKDGIEGTLRFADLPLSVEDFLVSLSLDTVFLVPQGGEWTAVVQNFEAAEVSSNFPAHPTVRVEAQVAQNRFLASAITYEDTVSRLVGDGYVLWNLEEGILESASFSTRLSNPDADEHLTIEGGASNPLGSPLTADSLKRDFFFSAYALVEGFPASRFLTRQKKGNTISFEASASGTLENPYLQAQVFDTSVFVGGGDMKVSAKASLVENVFSLSDTQITWRFFDFYSLTAQADLGSFTGVADIKATVDVAQSEVQTEVQMTLSNLSDVRTGFLPEAYSLEASFVTLEGGFSSEFRPFSFSVIRSPGRIDIATDENIGAFGEILDNGQTTFFVTEDKPLHFSMDGTLDFKKLTFDLNFRNMYWDVSKAASFINSDLFTLYSMVVDGGLRVYGLMSDPAFDGRLYLTNVDFNLPQYIPDHFTTAEAALDFEEETISLPETHFRVKRGGLEASAVAVIDRWLPISLEVHISTDEDEYFPVNAKLDNFRLKGNTSLDVAVLMEGDDVTLSGSVGLSNTTLEILMGGSGGFFGARRKQHEAKATTPSMSSDMNFMVNLDLLIGRKVQIDINPLLRGLIAPSTPISVSADTATGSWSVKGDVVLKGGEISYLSRSFYLKEGQLVLDETQESFDPVVTVRAETREHDSDGDSVTIVLSAASQHISNFNATLSSTPAKSENEIMEILGQIVAGDSSSAANLLVAGVDYGVQMTFLRKVEGALRDLCNFDIFSLRTTILQNSIIQGLNMNTDATYSNDSVIGNLFDNSTVYIGKYFGDAIYADALLHWSYDKTYSDVSSSGLVFQPEIGLEFDAPFANIRWNFAPDFGEIQQSWTQATSITLSWRLAF